MIHTLLADVKNTIFEEKEALDDMDKKIQELEKNLMDLRAKIKSLLDT